MAEKIETPEFGAADKSKLPPSKLASAPAETETEKELGLPAVVTFDTAHTHAGNRAAEFYHELAATGYGDFRAAGPKPDLAIRGLTIAAQEEGNTAAKEHLARVQAVFKKYQS